MQYAILYNLQVPVAATAVETEEVSAESSNALKKIDGKRSFPYHQYDKVCKSVKGGLPRHKNSKLCDMEGLDETGIALCEETFASSVESIKEKITTENFNLWNRN